MQDSNNGPQGQKHIAYLDGWRGIAIILVLLAHFGGIEYNVGPLGVNFFFALSGLLMSRILFVDKIPMKIFYRNRIARIFPVLYLYIAVVFISTLYNGYSFRVSDFGYALLFLRTYLGDTSIWDEPDVPLGHLWSLNVEEHCYILLSLISLLAMGRSKYFTNTAVAACALVCVACFGIYKFFPQNLHSPVFLRTEVAGFAIFISAAIFLLLRNFNISIPWYVPIISATAALIIGMLSTRGIYKYIIPQLLLAISVNTLSHAPAWLRRMLCNRILLWFGICSYSFYIWQQPFFILVQYSEEAYARYIAFIFALGIGTLSFYFYEQPMRKWIRGISSSKTKPSQPDIKQQPDLGEDVLYTT